MLGEKPLVPFAGLDDSMKGKMIVAALFGDNPALAEVVNIIANIERESGIPLIIAGRDYPSHCTILQTVGGFGAKDRLIADAGSNLPAVLVFTRAVLTTNCEILLMGPVEPVLDQARDGLHVRAAEAGGAGKKLPIMHMTGARLSIGGKVTQEARLMFADMVGKLNDRIAANSLALPFRVFVGTTHELLSGEVAIAA